MNSTFAARWNEPALEEKYERWSSDPSSVEPNWAAFFEGFALGCAQPASKNGAEPPAESRTDHLQTRIDGLVYAYRTLGHSVATLDPLSDSVSDNPLLSLKELGLDHVDPDVEVASPIFRDGKRMRLRDMINELRRIYCGTIGAEYMHIQNPHIRNWVRNRIENRDETIQQDRALHRELLSLLYDGETFESFLHTKYVGSKRFSLEGGEALLLILDTVLDYAERLKIKEIVMGMAHRGRLNVLANFLKKPLDLILNEFSDDYIPEHTMGGGDVKYHLGYQTVRKLPSGYEVEVYLAANPSHLEAVDPVVQGKVRARQRILEDTVERKKVLPLLIHGDAAFSGQGIVAEVFNMSQLPGYRTGGTLHVIVNNQIGFTTMPADARSTAYCTDIAKMVEAPVFHVNGDDPLAVITVAEIAADFRQEFGLDVVIDMVCYRRHGHNEGDEPLFTQPDLYAKIKSFPMLSERFSKQLIHCGSITQEEADSMKKAALERLDNVLGELKARKQGGKTSEFTGSTAVFQPPYSHEPASTAISHEMLDQIVRGLTSVPEGFNVLPKVKRILLDHRAKVHREGGPYDWAFAESLAIGSLLLENTPVRLSGQDSRRGTFSQRHSVLYDAKTRERFIPLMNLAEAQARFCVYNSPLSEAAILGFDYGYSMDYPSMLCMWEAQFGDFANGAQTIIDQFIASAESKWQRPSSIVMLLPHGYEGQGPEHSSARLERFLQLCAEENMQVCNLTTPAQYFHVLRRQIHRGYRKPLIIMTPKSLLRSDQAVSSQNEFTNSRFYEVIADDSVKGPKAERVIFCSGKVYYDLAAYRQENDLRDKVAIVRVEQFYPLHEEKVKRIASGYAKAKKFVWCQEEPSNMGAWTFMESRLRSLIGRDVAYAGRVAAASPAVGSSAIHKKQQAALVEEAFSV